MVDPCLRLVLSLLLLGKCGVALGRFPKSVPQALNAAWSALRGTQRVMEHESAPPLQSGDSIFVQTHTGHHFTVDHTHGGQVLANLKDPKGKLPLIVTKSGGGEIMDGDTIFLATHSGEYLDTMDGKLKARWTEVRDHSKIVITKVGGGAIRPNDAVFLKSLTGDLIRADGEHVEVKGKQYSSSQRFVIKRQPYGALHEVVGPDGVLMITLQREGEAARNGYSLEQLSTAKIFPVEFSATDAKTAPYWELQLTCPLESESGSAEWCEDMGRLGQTGCKSTIEQAITDSHRRALVTALNRQESASEWTAIIEDDVVPLRPEHFDDEFRRAWADLPSEAKIVRLGWCTFESDLGPILDRAYNSNSNSVDDGRDFKLVRERWWTDVDGSEHYYTGGCTTGYMVHRSFIPEMLKIFPCCCPIDCCMERQLFYAPAVNGTSDEYGKWRGAQIMVDMDARSARKYSSGFATFNQSGVLLQDNRNIKSERPEWNSAA